MFTVIKPAFEQTETESNSCEQGEATKPAASQLTDSGQSMSDQRDTFPRYGDFIDPSL